MGKGAWLADRKGATIVEYAILLFMVLVTAAAVFRILGKNTREATDKAAAQFHYH